MDAKSVDIKKIKELEKRIEVLESESISDDDLKSLQEIKRDLAAVIPGERPIDRLDKELWKIIDETWLGIGGRPSFKKALYVKRHKKEIKK